MKAYIRALNNFPIEDWAVSAYMGFKERQVSTIFFEEIEEVPLNKNNIVVSFVEETIQHLENLGVVVPRVMNIPKEIESYAQRSIRRITMGEYRKAHYLPTFIKPDFKPKSFQAGVITKESSIEFFKDVKDDEQIMTSEVVDLVSEFRGYVVDRELKGMHLYQGDFRKYPDFKVVEQAIKDFKSQPRGYSIDFGVTEKGDTVLIECNDGFSLGNYGLRADLYTNLLIKRWIELTS